MENEDLLAKAKLLAEQERIEKQKEQTESSTTSLITDTRPSDIVSSSLQNENGTIDIRKMQTAYFTQQFESGKSLQDVTIDMTKAKVTDDIINDSTEEGEKYRQELKDEQKATIKESFRQDKLKEQTNTMAEKKAKAEAFYNSLRPILEFDFDNLVRKKDAGDDKPQKTYKDRSYGIFLMVVMVVLLIIPYCAVSILLAIFNGVNAILETISTFGRISKAIATSVFVIVIIVLILYCGILGIESMFGISII